MKIFISVVKAISVVVGGFIAYISGNLAVTALKLGMIDIAIISIICMLWIVSITLFSCVVKITISDNEANHDNK